MDKFTQPEENVTGRFECHKCNKVLFSIKAVQLHNVRHHKNRIITVTGGWLAKTCDICRGNIQGIILGELNSKSAICPTCWKIREYKTSHDMPETEFTEIPETVTETVDEGENGVSCIKCGFWSETSGGLQVHMRVHVNGIKPIYVCDKLQCYDIFETLQNLLKHITEVHGRHMNEEKYILKCNLCEYLFPSIQKYKKHLNSHESSSITASKSDKIDDRKQPLKLKCCKLNCGAIYLGEELFMNHCLTHQYLKYKCNICETLYTNFRSFRKHQTSFHSTIDD